MASFICRWAWYRTVQALDSREKPKPRKTSLAMCSTPKCGLPDSLSAVPVVHEDAHERARQQQQERQREEEMGPVLGKEEIQRDGTQDDQADGTA